MNMYIFGGSIQYTTTAVQVHDLLGSWSHEAQTQKENREGTFICTCQRLGHNSFDTSSVVHRQGTWLAWCMYVCMQNR
jgi:hypothetical protein